MAEENPILVVTDPVQPSALLKSYHDQTRKCKAWRDVATSVRISGECLFITVVEIDGICYCDITTKECGSVRRSTWEALWKRLWALPTQKTHLVDPKWVKANNTAGYVQKIMTKRTKYRLISQYWSNIEILPRPTVSQCSKLFGFINFMMDVYCTKYQRRCNYHLDLPHISFSIPYVHFPITRWNIMVWLLIDSSGQHTDGMGTECVDWPDLFHFFICNPQQIHAMDNKKYMQASATDLSEVACTSKDARNGGLSTAKGTTWLHWFSNNP